MAGGGGGGGIFEVRGMTFSKGQLLMPNKIDTLPTSRQPQNKAFHHKVHIQYTDDVAH